MSAPHLALIDIMSGLGPWIKNRRAYLRSKGIKTSHREMGQYVGKSHVQVGNYEDGSSEPPVAVVGLIAEALYDPGATEEENERVKSEALLAFVGIEIKEFVRELDPDYVADYIHAYEGNDYRIIGAKTGMAVSEGYQRASAASRVIPPEEDWIEEVDGPRLVKQ